MRILIFGATGMLGKDLVRAFSAHEVRGLGSRDVDVCDPARVLHTVQQIRPDWIVLSAAYTDVDGCEADPKRAFAVNRDGAGHVAQAASLSGARLMFVSSDYVFDGEKRTPYEVRDARNPINVYGLSKAVAEERLLEIAPQCCIVRTSWLFGAGGKCFPDTVLQLAKTRSELKVVDDQRGCPTCTSDLARGMLELAERTASGIVHATNQGSCSWFEFAQAVLSASPNIKVLPVTSAEFPRPAKRPSYSVLSDRSLRERSVAMPTWQDALTRYLRERSTNER